MPEPADLPATKAKSLLAQSGLRAKKGLGQHFLVDRRVLGRVVSAGDLTPEDTVIEVGPGLGVLTQELVQRAGRVIAIEADGEMVSALGDLVARSPNLTIIHGDIMHLDPVSLLPSPSQVPVSYKVVANIPYYITSAVLRHFLEASRQPTLMVVMVQKEVGQGDSGPTGRHEPAGGQHPVLRQAVHSGPCPGQKLLSRAKGGFGDSACGCL